MRAGSQCSFPRTCSHFCLIQLGSIQIKGGKTSSNRLPPLQTATTFPQSGTCSCHLQAQTSPQVFRAVTRIKVMGQLSQHPSRDMNIMKDLNRSDSPPRVTQIKIMADEKVTEGDSCSAHLSGSECAII